MAADRIIKLALSGLAAGTFSALFGVGAGSILVPCFLWLGYNERCATGTSLAAITIIAAYAAFVQGLYGNVHLEYSLLVGVPAVAGVFFGTWVQQRVPLNWISLLFSLLLVVIAIRMIVG